MVVPTANPTSSSPVTTSENTTQEYTMLDCQGIKKVYPTPKGPFVVLEDFNLKIKEGEFISIIGHSVVVNQLSLYDCWPKLH